MKARHFDSFDPAKFTIAEVDTETAFASATKKQCRLIFGNEEALKTLMNGFLRVKLAYVLDGPWIASETITGYRDKKSAEEMKRIRDDAEAKQRLADQQAMAQERAKQDGTTKAARQAELRAKWEGKAVPLEKDFRIRLQEFVAASATNVDKTRLAGWFPEFGKWYREKLLQGWSYEEGKTATDIFDYGEALWSAGAPGEARLLDAIVLKFRFLLVHPVNGREEVSCFIGGYIDDVRFDRIRGPLYAPSPSCSKEEDERIVKNWKIAQKFKSLWFAE